MDALSSEKMHQGPFHDVAVVDMFDLVGQDTRDLFRGFGLVQKPRIEGNDPTQARVGIDDGTVGHMDLDGESPVAGFDGIEALDQALEQGLGGGVIPAFLSRQVQPGGFPKVLFPTPRDDVRQRGQPDREKPSQDASHYKPDQTLEF